MTFISRHPVKTLPLCIPIALLILAAISNQHTLIDRFLGLIGVQGNTSSDSFLLSFWSGLLSGALYSLLIGAIVGIAVGRQVSASQADLEQRRERRLTKVNLDEVVRRARTSTMMPRQFDLGTAIGAIPSDLKGTLSVLGTADVAIANAIIGDTVRSATVLARANELYHACLESATELDRQLPMQILHAVPPQVLSTGTGECLIRDYVFRKILSQIPILGQSPPPTSVTAITNAGDNLLVVPRIAPLFNRYRSTLSDLVTHYENDLKPSLQGHEFGLSSL